MNEYHPLFTARATRSRHAAAAATAAVAPPRPTGATGASLAAAPSSELHTRPPSAITEVEHVAAWCVERRRVYGFLHAVPMVVLLSPCLPVHSYPELSAPTVGFYAAGEVVNALAACGGWIELAPVEPRRGAPCGRRGATLHRLWVLMDGQVPSSGPVEMHALCNGRLLLSPRNPRLHPDPSHR